jgi:hypothetical protein
MVAGCTIPTPPIPQSLHSEDQWVWTPLDRADEIRNAVAAEWRRTQPWPAACNDTWLAVVVWRPADLATFERHCPVPGSLACSDVGRADLYIPTTGPVEYQQANLIHELLHMAGSCAWGNADPGHQNQAIWDSRGIHATNIEGRIKIQFGVQDY